MSDPRDRGAAPFRMRPYWIGLAAIAVFTLWPLLAAQAALSLADLGHCTLVEAGPRPCPLPGGDWGGALYDLAEMGGLSVFSIPVGMTLLFLWLLALIVARQAEARRRAGVLSTTALDISFRYYGFALLCIVGLGYAVLGGWLPGPLLFVVLFAAIFWLFSFVFALISTLRRFRNMP